MRSCASLRSLLSMSATVVSSGVQCLGVLFMRHVYGNAFATAKEMQGQFVQDADKIVPPYKWSRCIKVLVDKPAITLAYWGNVEERTAKRWMAGEFPISIQAWLKMQEEMFKREGE